MKLLPAPRKRSEGDSSLALTFKIVVVALAITSLAGLAFALRYMRLEAAEPDFNSIVCNTDKTKCTQTDVAYANLRVYSCDQYVAFPPDQGNPLGHHTHKQANRIHWHGSYQVDPATKQPVMSLPRTIDIMLRDMGYDLPERCNGTTPTTVITINGVETPQGLQAVWNNDDIVVVTHK